VTSSSRAFGVVEVAALHDGGPADAAVLAGTLFEMPSVVPVGPLPGLERAAE
jgi:hypothetical protein